MLQCARRLVRIVECRRPIAGVSVRKDRWESTVLVLAYFCCETISLVLRPANVIKLNSLQFVVFVMQAEYRLTKIVSIERE